MEYTDAEFEALKAINPYDRENIPDAEVVEQAFELVQEYVKEELAAAGQEALEEALR